MYNWFRSRSSVNESQDNKNSSGIPESEASSTDQKEVQRRLHMVFQGEVQGVGFRWNARSCADELGLSGWVRNEWDGSVSMELQGTTSQIAQFFTLFNKHYDRFHISYTIDEKEDIPIQANETDFKVLFN